MNLAIIADIHGNRHALEAVLRDIATQNIDQLIVAGDVVNRGPTNAEVMARVSAEADVILLGNHDALVTKWVGRDSEIPAAWFSDPFWRFTDWTAQQLAAAGQLDALRELEFSYRIAIDGLPSVLITHGSPRHFREGYGRYLNDEQLAEIVEEYPADLYVGAHTHRTMVRAWGHHAFLNVGAVGAPFNRDQRAQYLLLSGRDGDWHHEFRAVDYDVDAALADYEQTGYLDQVGVSADIFFKEIQYARPLYAPFWMWSEKEGIPKSAASWQAWQQGEGADFFEPPEPAHGPPRPDIL
ncbi:MAG: metallophosphoesterase [Anaerolineales bacterium]|nr:metallophosphoesterase [Anaerolineales bacterium]MCB9127055.1 metallophosphoesterase [Ardenticatenales bacterium]MCB9172420.1 metallophosphoesterase [Ardenticatenales bacterium]